MVTIVDCTYNFVNDFAATRSCLVTDVNKSLTAGGRSPPVDALRHSDSLLAASKVDYVNGRIIGDSHANSCGLHELIAIVDVAGDRSGWADDRPSANCNC